MLGAVLDRGPLRHKLTLTQTAIVLSAPVTVEAVDAGAVCLMC